MPDFNVGVVITAPEGREANLSRVLGALEAQTMRAKVIVLVFDGCAPYALMEAQTPMFAVSIAKHVPGFEQPRNVGVRELLRVAPECEYVYFLDSDVVIGPDVIATFAAAMELARPRILVGPYDWLPWGVEGIHPNGPFWMRDGRWENDFDVYGPEVVREGWVGHGLACFGGNLVWPISDFTRMGGFHPNMYHGRCEDGEHGLRAMTHGYGVSFVREARGFHQMHAVDGDRQLALNAIEVPKINTWHPYAPAGGPVVLGQRFTFECGACGESMDSLDWWEHGCNAR